MNANGYNTRRILIVEDELSIGKMCQIILTREGYKVDIAIDGIGAQDVIWEEEYNLCLVDMRMPRMNGKEFYQWLQKKYPRLSGRVIFTTGDVMDANIKTFIENSGRPFLPKPFTPNELKIIVKETVKKAGG